MSLADEAGEQRAALLRTIEGEPRRETYIGSSDAAAISECGAYGNTPLSVYLRKIGEAPEQLDADRLRFLERRKRWEPVILEMLREEFDCPVVACNRRYVHPLYDFIAGEVDFEWTDPDTGEIENGEIKTVSSFAFNEKHGWGEAGTEDIPAHYTAQAMHNLGITGRKICVVAAMVGLDTMVFYRVYRDEEVIRDLLHRCVQFWANHVLPRVPPEALTHEDQMLIARRMRGRPVEATPEMKALLTEIKTGRQKAKALDDEIDEKRYQLNKLILAQWQVDPIPLTDDGEIDLANCPKENAALLVDGMPYASWNLQETRRIDPKALRKDLPDMFFKYSKVSLSRRLIFKRIGV